MIRYNSTKRRILQFIESYGFITAKICADMFYKNNKYRINQSRNTLNALVKAGDLVCTTQDNSREKIYQFTKKLIKKHDYYILNLFAEMNRIGEVEDMITEKHWMDGLRRSDGMVTLVINNGKEKLFNRFFIECDFTHKTDSDKYIELYNSDEPQQYMLDNYDIDIFPDVIQLNYNGIPNIRSNGDFNVIGIDFSFKDLASKLLL